MIGYFYGERFSDKKLNPYNFSPFIFMFLQKIENLIALMGYLIKELSGSKTVTSCITGGIPNEPTV